jgi:hypothetical protein
MESMTPLLGRPPTPASVRLLRSEGLERVPDTGAVASVQEAVVTLPRSLLDQLWSPEYLERLARAYWRHVTRASLGVIRIVYERDARAAVLISRRLPLLRFHAPEYEASADRGRVTWRIERGLLVARAGRGQGFLRISISRPRETPAAGAGPRAGAESRPGAERWPGEGPGPGAGPQAREARVQVRMEVRNFYPWLRGSGRFARFGAWLYGQTQLRIHVLVCNSFLRSLARLELPPSRVGALAGIGQGGTGAV